MEYKLITEKLFRVRENIKKLEFIIQNSDISFEIIQKAAIVSQRNPYHNFGHELGATEQAIKIAIAENRSEQEINLIALAMLFHDADHRGIVKLYDEMNAVDLASRVLTATDTIIAGADHNKVMQGMRDLILSTIFPGTRGKNNDPIVKIIQDADLAHFGHGTIYWAWASMGLIDEFNLNLEVPLTPQVFIRETQEKFINFLATLSGDGEVYLSSGARKIFRNPLKDVVEFKTWSDQAINYAYMVRREDVTLEEFEKETISLNQI